MNRVSKKTNKLQELIPPGCSLRFKDADFFVANQSIPSDWASIQKAARCWPLRATDLKFPGLVCFARNEISRDFANERVGNFLKRGVHVILAGKLKTRDTQGVVKIPLSLRGQSYVHDSNGAYASTPWKLLKFGHHNGVRYSLIHAEPTGATPLLPQLTNHLNYSVGGDIATQGDVLLAFVSSLKFDSFGGGLVQVASNPPGNFQEIVHACGWLLPRWKERLVEVKDEDTEDAGDIRAEQEIEAKDHDENHEFSLTRRFAEHEDEKRRQRVALFSQLK